MAQTVATTVRYPVGKTTFCFEKNYYEAMKKGSSWLVLHSGIQNYILKLVILRVIYNVNVMYKSIPGSHSSFLFFGGV